MKICKIIITEKERMIVMFRININKNKWINSLNPMKMIIIK